MQHVYVWPCRAPGPVRRRRARDSPDPNCTLCSIELRALCSEKRDTWARVPVWTCVRARGAEARAEASVARARIWHLRPHTRRQRVCVLSVSSRHTDGDRTQIWSDKYGALSSQYFLLSLIKPYFTQSRASAHSLHESVRDRDRAGDDHNAQRSNVECVNKVLVRFLDVNYRHTPQNQSKYAETHTLFD